MEECYKQYLKNHSEPKVKLMHFIGQLVTMLYPIWVIYFEYWLLLFFTPFVIYPFAVSSHYMFGKKGSKPSFHKMGFFKAKICDFMMFIDILKGKYRIW